MYAFLDSCLAGCFSYSLGKVLQKSSGNFPFLVDIDPLTGNISPKTLDLVEIESPAVLVVCHMYGLGAPIASISEWAKRRGMLVIEDATLALGAIVDGRPAGSWGDISLFSFGEGKIVEVGTGGVFLCDNSELARKVQIELDELPPWSKRIDQLWNQWSELYWLLHQYEEENPQLAIIYPMLFRIFGDVTRYQIPVSRWNRLVKALSLIETNLDHRLEMALLYDEYFKPMQVRTLQRPKGHVMWRYPLLVPPKDRDALLEVLWENGILASRWYPLIDNTNRVRMIGFDALAGFVADKPPRSSNPLSDVYLCALLARCFFLLLPQSGNKRRQEQTN